MFAFMRNTFSLPPLRSPGSEANPAFNVVIAYEDFETGQHARKTYDFLVEHLGEEFCLHNQMWKFDVLAMPKLREMAASDAAAADIVMVAVRGSNELPAEVKEWMELWLSQGTRAIAVVALFEDSGQSIANLVQDYLAEVARRANVEFFSQPGVWPTPARDHDRQAGDSRMREEKAFSLLAGAVQSDPEIRHWGINE